MLLDTVVVSVIWSIGVKGMQYAVLGTLER